MDDTEDIPLSPFEPISSIEIVSETETVTTNSSNSLNRKKRKNSHTTTTPNPATIKAIHPIFFTLIQLISPSLIVKYVKVI